MSALELRVWAMTPQLKRAVRQDYKLGHLVAWICETHGITRRELHQIVGKDAIRSRRKEHSWQ